MKSLLRVVCLTGVFVMIGTTTTAEDQQANPALLRAECAMYKAEVAKKAEQIKELKAELEVASAKLDKMAAKLKQLEVANKALEQMLAKATGKKDITKPLPLDGSETLITQIKADPRSFVGKSFILVGGVKNRAYYNYEYMDAASTHASIDFYELRADWTPTGESGDLYMKRVLAKPLTDAIVEIVKSGKEYKLVRVKVTILARRFDANSPAMFEIQDWQFLDKDTNTWGPWQKAMPRKPPTGTNRNIRSKRTRTSR